MEWLKDKKNLPYVAGGGAIVLILAIILILWETGVLGGQQQQAASGMPPGMYAGAGGYPGAGSYPGTGAYPGAGGYPGSFPGANPYPGDGYPGMGAPGAPMGYPGMGGASGYPGAMGGATAASPTEKPVSHKPPVNVAKGPDPFKAVFPKVVVQHPKKPHVNQLVASVNIASYAGERNGQFGPIPDILITPQESPNMRVSGVIQTSSGVHAVLEANGQSLPVQPGDSVGGGKVLSIQSDGLMLKSQDGTLVHVPLGSGPPQGVGYGGYPGGGYGGYPGGGYGGGYPGGGYGGYPGGGYGGFPGDTPPPP